MLVNLTERVDQLGDPVSHADKERHDSFHDVPPRTATMTDHDQVLPALSPGRCIPGTGAGNPAAAQIRPGAARAPDLILTGQASLYRSLSAFVSGLLATQSAAHNAPKTP